jgi:hypothetical protein
MEVRRDGTSVAQAMAKGVSVMKLATWKLLVGAAMVLPGCMTDGDDNNLEQSESAVCVPVEPGDCGTGPGDPANPTAPPPLPPAASSKATELSLVFVRAALAAAGDDAIRDYNSSGEGGTLSWNGATPITCGRSCNWAPVPPTTANPRAWTYSKMNFHLSALAGLIQRDISVSVKMSASCYGWEDDGVGKLDLRLLNENPIISGGTFAEDVFDFFIAGGFTSSLDQKIKTRLGTSAMTIGFGPCTSLGAATTNSGDIDDVFRWDPYRTSFETSDFPTTWSNSTAYAPVNVSGYLSGIAPECSVRQEQSTTGGTRALMFSGTDNSASQSFVYFKVYDVNIPVDSKTRLSYAIRPQTANARFVAVDILFTDGTNLRDSGAIDTRGFSMHPKAGHGGAIPLNAWTTIESNIGAKRAGKTIDKILVAYDQPAGTGQFRGYIDDIRIWDPPSL